MRVPLSMLYVTFENSDRLGYLLAWISALPTFILFFIGAMVVLYSIYIYILYSTESANKVSPPHTVVVWIWYENNPYVFLRWLCYILLGQVFCEFLAVLLKDLLKGERPLASDRHGFDFGNPSSHTQFITFFAYMCLRRLYSKRRKTPTLIAILDATVLTGLVPLVALSRIYLEYHYLYQRAGIVLLFPSLLTNNMHSDLEINFTRKLYERCCWIRATFIIPLDRVTGAPAREVAVQGNAGQTLLSLAHENDVELEGACDGSLACSTCHVILDKRTYDVLPEASDEENDMLDLAFGLTETSRLGCQVKLDPSIEGMVAKIPAATRNIAVDGYKPPKH
ncbi:mitochondrial matrix iron-sulfur protein [Mitosporidium daphniae]